MTRISIYLLAKNPGACKYYSMFSWFLTIKIMEQLLPLSNLKCVACKAAIVKESQIIRHYFQLIKRGIFMDYHFFVCKFCYEERHKFYTLQTGYTILKEYPLGD